MSAGNGTALRPESEITAAWDARSGIQVSVICTTFNHEPFVADALDGFLEQQGPGAFEIIVHDDASTDGTRAIIEDYHRRYPGIIRPILQSENQFSKGGFRPALHAVGFARGKFIALCEGDDYWIDPHKLRCQAEVLADREDLDFCIHDARCTDPGGRDTAYSFQERVQREHVIPYREVFTCRGQFCPTSSFFIRARALQDIPSFVFDAPIGDFFIEALAGTGGIYYLPRKMSVYRRGVPGGWSHTTVSNIARSIEFNTRMLDSLAHLEAWLPAETRGLVRYKRRDVQLNLANRHLQAGQRGTAARFWVKSLLAAGLDRRQLSFIPRLLGLRQGQ